jgi:hypothetical protein
MSRTALKRKIRSRFKEACEEAGLSHGAGYTYRAYFGDEPQGDPMKWRDALNAADPGDTLTVAVHRGVAIHRGDRLGAVTIETPPMPDTNHGGEREGAGRKKRGGSTRVHLTASLTPAQKQYVEDVGGDSATTGVRRLIRFHKQNTP